MPSTIMALPDLGEYTHHRTDAAAAFEGIPVPGLRAVFYRRPDGERTASVGHYTFAGRDLLLAWGYVDEEHCRHSAVRDPDGDWHPPTAGCPVVRLIRDDDQPDAPVVGLAVRAPTGAWITADRVS